MGTYLPKQVRFVWVCWEKSGALHLPSAQHCSRSKRCCLHQSRITRKTKKWRNNTRTTVTYSTKQPKSGQRPSRSKAPDRQQTSIDMDFGEFQVKCVFLK